MQPVGHFAIGGSFAFLVNMLVYLGRGGRTTFRHLVLMPVTIILSGFWAFGPDWARFFTHLLHLPYAYSQEAHRPGWPDIFFFHGILDDRFAGRGAMMGLLAVIFMFLTLMVIYLLEIRRLLKTCRKNPS